MRRGGLQQNRAAKTEADRDCSCAGKTGRPDRFVWVTVDAAVHFCNALRVVSEASTVPDSRNKRVVRPVARARQSVQFCTIGHRLRRCNGGDGDDKKERTRQEGARTSLG